VAPRVATAAPIVIVPPSPTKPVISADDRCRQIRDVHLLCLAELRPKAWPEYRARF
jgi:hypothetical protein